MASLKVAWNLSTPTCTNATPFSIFPVCSNAPKPHEWAGARRDELLHARVGFVSETVFSHESTPGLIGHAQSLGYQVALYAVCLDDPQRLLARVSQWVREDGHTVPAN